MAISTKIRKTQFNTSGGFVASYPFAFKFWDETEIKATLSTTTGDVALTYGVDYSVSTPGDSGTLTRIITAAWVAAVRLTIYREIDLSQEVVLVNGGTQDADIYMQMVDRTVAMSQESDEVLDRLVRFPITDTGTIPELPSAASRAGYLLGFDAITGDPLPMVGTSGHSATPYMITLLDDIDASAAQSTLGVSDFVKTLLNDADASTFLNTLLATTFGKSILQNAVSGTKISGLDADTVSGYGIGITEAPTMATSWDNYLRTGTFRDTGNLTNNPYGVACYCIVITSDVNIVAQIAFNPNTLQLKIRTKFGTWTPWATIWNTTTDGNGGQPPAPKPNRAGSSGSYVQGRLLAGLITEGSMIHYSGATNESGTWEINNFIKENATNSPVWASWGVEIGSGSWYTLGAGYTSYYIARRIA